jgi:hypothetical protein
MFIMFVTLTLLLLYFPFLMENSQLKNIMCVLIQLTVVIIGVHNDENVFQPRLA